MATKKKSHASTPSVTSRQRTGIIILASVLGILTGALVIFLLLRPTTPPLVTPAAVQQTVRTATADTTVLSSKTVPARELMSGAVIEGKNGLVVRLKVTNTTDAPQHFLPVHQVFIKGSGDAIYQMTPLAGVADPIVAGEIAPGKTLEGDISFMIDEGATELQLYIDTRWNGVTPSIIRL